MKKIFSEKGFTLVEVLIAITIIVIVFAASVQVFLGNIILTQTNEGITKAVNDLSDVMEMIMDSSLVYLMQQYPDPENDGADIPLADITMESTLDGETITIYYQQAFNPGPTEIGVTISWIQNARTINVEARTLKF